VTGRRAWKEAGSRADGVTVETTQLDGEACGRFFLVTRCLDADVNEALIRCAGYDLMRK
jgi:hypothetical protein